MDLGLINWLKPGKWLRNCDCFLRQVRLLLPWPGIFLFIQIKQEFSKLLCISLCESLSLQESGCPGHCLALWSITAITPSLTLVVRCCHLTPATPGPMTPPALRLLTAVAEVPTVRSGLHLRVITEDFPDGPMDKNPPGNAGDTGLTPGRERFHMPGNNVVHAPQLLSVHAATTWVCMPQLLECACCKYCSPCR